MERPILDVNQLGDLANYGLEEVTPEAVSAAYWETRFPVIEGGSGRIDFSDLDNFGVEQKSWFKGAVEGVAGGLKGVGKWLYDNSSLLQAYDRMVNSATSPKAVEPAPPPRGARLAGAGVTPLTTEELKQRSENSWLGKNLREGLAKAPKVNKAALLGTGLNIATLAAGFGIGYIGTGSGTEAMLRMELNGAFLAAVGQLGIIVSMRSERAIEGTSEAESRYARVVQSLQRGCANHAVRAAFRMARNLGAGAMAGSGFHYAVEMLSAGRQAVAGAPAPTEAAGAPVPAEVGSATDIANAIGDTRREVIDAAQQGAQLAGQNAAEVAQQQIAETLSQSMDMLTQANSIVAGISPDVANDPSVQGVTEQARQAVEAYNQFSASAVAGGIDAGEAAQLQQLAADAINAANQAADTANQIVQQAADTAAAQAAARQATLQTGDVMRNVIAATPSGTAFEALQQQVFRVTGSPYAAEVANAMSWTLPKGDITGLHVGAIQEGAKTVAGFLQQAHDFAAANGGEYTVHAIRQAVSDGRLSKDVLDAVEAANLPAGEGKNQAIQALNTVLQSIIK